MFKKKSAINAAIVGFGFSGSTFHTPFLNALKEYNVRYVVSKNPEKVKEVLPNGWVEPNFHKILEDSSLDLIVITTPNSTHYELAKTSLEAGKHVVVDKPFTLNTKEAEELIQIAAQHKKILTVFHNRRWDGDFLTVKKLLAEEVLGEIYLYEAHFHRFRPIANIHRWKENELLGSGIFYDLAPHLLDQALMLFGIPDSIDSDIIIQRPGAIADDYFHLILKYGKKRVILKASNLVCNPGPRYQIHGIKGSFLKNGIDPQEQDLIAKKNPLDKNWGYDNSENYGILSLIEYDKKIPTVPGNYHAFYQTLAGAIQHNSEPPVLAEEALQVIQLMEVCRAQSKNEQ